VYWVDFLQFGTCGELVLCAIYVLVKGKRISLFLFSVEVERRDSDASWQACRMSLDCLNGSLDELNEWSTLSADDGCHWIV
jgi:hypothetical protein